MRILSLLLLFFVAPALAEPPIKSGDRVAIVGNTFADQLRIHAYLETLLIQHSDVSVRNLGWGGDMLTARDRPKGFPTEESTLLKHKTDVIIACFGMGESFAGEPGLDRFKEEVEGFVDSHKGKIYNGKSEVRVILVSPIAYEDRGKTTPAVKQRNSDLKAYTEAMAETAKALGVPFVDLFETSRYLMSESDGAKLTTNGIHLNSFGYWAISHAFFEQLSGAATQPWKLVIDAEFAIGNATQVQLSELEQHGESFRFKVTETSAPSLPPETESELPVQLASKRDSLVVTQLPEGDYTLWIDDVEVVTASHEGWNRGVPIDSSPSHLEAEAFREVINDKNLQFTYSWKALNQVHIVGERKRSKSGRAIPDEVVAFKKLADARDAELRNGHEQKQRLWRLEPTKP